MLEQDEPFKHLYDNPTYIRPEDWLEVDSLVDWLIEEGCRARSLHQKMRRLSVARPPRLGVELN